MIVKKRQAKGSYWCQSFYHSLQTSKRKRSLNRVWPQIEFKQKKARRSPKPQFAYRTTLVLIIANKNAVLAFKKFLFLLKHNDGSVIHSKQLYNPFCNLLQSFSRFLCSIGQLEHPYVTLATAKWKLTFSLFLFFTYNFSFLFFCSLHSSNVKR